MGSGPGVRQSLPLLIEGDANGIHRTKLHGKNAYIGSHFQRDLCINSVFLLPCHPLSPFESRLQRDNLLSQRQRTHTRPLTKTSAQPYVE